MKKLTNNQLRLEISLLFADQTICGSAGIMSENYAYQRRKIESNKAT